MYALGSWLVPSDEIRLYSKDMLLRYTEYVTKTRIEPIEATGIYSFVFIPYMCWIWGRKFGSTSDQVRWMAFYLHTDVIDETILSIRDEIGIITKDL